MRIVDMPRPWLLAAMTGVPMAALLRRAEQEDAERSEEPSCPLPEEHLGSQDRDRRAGRSRRSDVVRLTLLS